MDQERWRSSSESPHAQVRLREGPSASECRFCDITEDDCPERVSIGVAEGVTADF